MVGLLIGSRHRRVLFNRIVSQNPSYGGVRGTVYFLFQHPRRPHSGVLINPPREHFNEER
uniref:Uncharacterized protein n=1 Tax=uncultured marine group II/III euryarchaeote AD1000_88_D12 TaxID=1457821 RepID=A0A075G0J1_9EURY|nr:hypothetical protein [uncultured marine group II/III euryarchaeote AD1000_88_D12]